MPDNPGEITLRASTPGAESDPAGVTVFDIASIKSGKIIPVYAGELFRTGQFKLYTTTDPTGYARYLTPFTFSPTTAPSLSSNSSEGMREQTITISRKGCIDSAEGESISADIMIVDRDWWSEPETFEIGLPPQFETILNGINSGLQVLQLVSKSPVEGIDIQATGKITTKEAKRIQECKIIPLKRLSWFRRGKC